MRAIACSISSGRFASLSQIVGHPRMGENPHPLHVVVELLAGQRFDDRRHFGQRPVTVLFGKENFHVELDFAFHRRRIEQHFVRRHAAPSAVLATAANCSPHAASHAYGRRAIWSYSSWCWKKLYCANRLYSRRVGPNSPSSSSPAGPSPAACRSPSTIGASVRRNSASKSSDECSRIKRPLEHRRGRAHRVMPVHFAEHDIAGKNQHFRRGFPLVGQRQAVARLVQTQAADQSLLVEMPAIGNARMQTVALQVIHFVHVDRSGKQAGKNAGANLAGPLRQ